jgi:hypothetical protein
MLLSLLISVPGWVAYLCGKRNRDWMWMSWFITGILIFAISIGWLIGYDVSRDNYREYQALQSTITMVRERGASDIEEATFIPMIMDANSSLAHAKRVSNTIFQDMIMDKYADCDYLK